MIRLEDGEEWSLEIGDYTFTFIGPAELRSADLARLRRSVRAATEAEMKIRQQQKKQRTIGFN